jgi:hypothetical protein
MKTRASSLAAGALLTLWLVVLVWVLCFNPATRFVPLALLAEAAAFVVIVLSFWKWAPLNRFIRGMPGPHRVVFGVLIALVFAGHFSLQARRYFPFVAWEIFPLVREDDPVTCRELIATTAQGRRVRLLVEQLFPSIVQFNFPTDPAKLDRLVTVLAAAYNRQHAADPVREADLVTMAVQLHPAPGEVRSQPSCALLQHYDF